MSDTAEMFVMLGTVISMLSTISKTVDRYDRIMKRLERAQVATEDGDESEKEKLEAVRAWHEDCARADYEMEMSEKPKKRRIKKERDPERPKRGKSAYFLWCDDNRKIVRQDMEKELLEQCDESEIPTPISAATVSKRLGSMWKTVDEEEKSRYTVLAKTHMDRYHAEMKAYNSDRGIIKRKPAKVSISPDTEAHVELPEGWTGPFEGFLERCPVDPETGKRVTCGFATFAQAFAEAERLGDACGGITLSTDKKGNRRLTLREATNLIFKPEWNVTKKETSFIAPH
jgi:hypothetical protein